MKYLGSTENALSILTNQQAENKFVQKVAGKSLSTNDLTDELVSMIQAAEPNKIETIMINNTPLEITDKSVNIPIATNSKLGVIMSSPNANSITVNADGTMMVNNLSISKVQQSDDEEIIFDCGSASIK